MYLRFITSGIDEDSEREVGLFHAVFELRDSGKLSVEEEARLKEISDWFDENLEKPKRFTTSKPPHYRKKSKALSWFKDGAEEHLSRIREISEILRHHNIPTRMLKTDRVGYIVYEDQFQIVAEPFADTPR